MAVPEGIHKAIQDAKYKDPSPIQRQAIRGVGVTRFDRCRRNGLREDRSFRRASTCVCCSITSTAYRVVSRRRSVSCGTSSYKELAQQINDEIAKLSTYLSCKTTTIVGGRSIEDQGFLLREGVEIIVGTPGQNK